MPFIDVVQPDEAEPESELADFYERVGAERGNVANVLQVTSLHPPLSHAHLDLYLSIMYDQDAGLDRRQRELIAVAVSWMNDCEYCITHHKEAFERYEDDETLVEALVRDPKTAPLEKADKALVAYAMKLTRAPGSVGEQDVEALRKVGFDDEDILAAGAVASYFNFVNRLNLGLGAELEGEAEREYEY